MAIVRFKPIHLFPDQRAIAERLLVFWYGLAPKLSLPEYTETKLLQLISHEMATRGRKEVLNRLHGRYCKLRRAREIKEILRDVGR